MSRPPEGERPGDGEPFEGEPPESLGPEEGKREELPDLEPEFVEALQAAEEPEPSTDADPEADAEPALGGAAAEPSSEQPTEEKALPDPEKTVEFTPDEVAEAQGSEGAVEATAQADATPGPPPPAPPAAPPPTAATPAPPPPPAATPGIPQKPPPEGDSEPAPRRRRLWLSFSLGSLLIVAAVASAVAASILLEVKGIAEALQPIPKVKKYLRQVESGEPQNILVLGSDRRASLEGTRGLSDTTILLRLDPDNNAIALLNIPRDLKTEIPGFGTDKFNAAYAYGGPKLTLQTVKNLTGLPIDHVVNVDFLGFIRAINAIECVYIDVDRRYFHSNRRGSRRASVRRDRRPARISEALRQGRAGLRPLPPHGHRPGARRAPAGLPARGPRAGAGCRPGAARGARRADRDLHQVHVV